MNLNELILTHKGSRSYDDLERACGKVLTSQRLQQIATTVPKEFPKAGNIRAIAQALGVSELVVVMAAAESLGLDVSRELPRLLQVLPAAVSDLSDEEVAAIAHVIRAFKREEVMGNAEHPAPTIESDNVTELTSVQKRAKKQAEFIANQSAAEQRKRAAKKSTGKSPAEGVRDDQDAQADETGR